MTSSVTDLCDAVAKVTQLVVDGLQLFLHVLLAVRQHGKLTAQAAQHMLYPTYTPKKKNPVSPFFFFPLNLCANPVYNNCEELFTQCYL